MEENNEKTSITSRTQNLQTQLVNIFAPDDQKSEIRESNSSSNLLPKLDSQLSVNKNMILNKVSLIFCFPPSSNLLL